MIDPILSLFLVTAVGAVAMGAWYLREWRLLFPPAKPWRRRLQDAMFGLGFGIGCWLMRRLARNEPPSDEVPWQG